MNKEKKRGRRRRRKAYVSFYTAVDKNDGSVFTKRFISNFSCNLNLSVCVCVYRISLKFETFFVWERKQRRMLRKIDDQVFLSIKKMNTFAQKMCMYVCINSCSCIRE